MYGKGFWFVCAREGPAFLDHTKPGVSLKTLFKSFESLYFNFMKYPTKNFPVRLGVHTQKIVKPIFKARGLMEGKIITQWPQIVGEKFARLALAEKITFPQGKKTEGTLHLSVTSSGALLLQYAQDLILEQVNTYFGYNALSKLRMTHGFIPPQENPSPVIPPPISQEDKEWLEGQMERIQDSELKLCLERLGEAVCR